MSTVEILAGSIEYVRWPVTVTDAAGATVDPRGDTVQLAFRAPRDGTALTWYAATWETAGGVYYAKALIGSGNFVLAAGVWNVYLKVTDSPEVPVLDLGTLYVA